MPVKIDCHFRLFSTCITDVNIQRDATNPPKRGTILAARGRCRPTLNVVYYESVEVDIDGNYVDDLLNDCLTSYFL